MLILTRKVNERIVIGDDIEVSVVEIRGDQVKLGISAPQNVKVHRREVFDQIQAENRAAALSASPDLAGLAGLFSPDQPASSGAPVAAEPSNPKPGGDGDTPAAVTPSPPEGANESSSETPTGD
jgi:carbon storage regulator